jgi:hypothetical protein
MTSSSRTLKEESSSLRLALWTLWTCPPQGLTKTQPTTRLTTTEAIPPNSQPNTRPSLRTRSALTKTRLSWLIDSWQSNSWTRISQLETMRLTCPNWQVAHCSAPCLTTDRGITRYLMITSVTSMGKEGRLRARSISTGEGAVTWVHLYRELKCYWTINSNISSGLTLTWSVTREA